MQESLAGVSSVNEPVLGERHREAVGPNRANPVMTMARPRLLERTITASARQGLPGMPMGVAMHVLSG